MGFGELMGWSAAASARLRGRAFIYLYFGLFAAFATVNIIHHTPWRDELQAFLLGRDSANPITLFQNLAYEGHPGLWYILLFGAARIWNSPEVLKALQLVVTYAILALIWFKSPFSILEKAAICLGYFFLLEYTVIAREYGLGVALFFAAIAWRRSTKSWLLIGLMANTSVHFAVVAGILGILLLHWGNRNPWAVAASTILALIATATMYPAPDVFTSEPKAPLLARGVLVALHASGAMLPFGWGHNLFVDSRAISLMRLPLSLAIIVGGAYSLKKAAPLDWAFLAVCAGLIAIGLFAYTGQDRHYGIIWIALIGFHWISRQDGQVETADGIFRISVFASSIIGPLIAYSSLTGPFSGSQAASEWIIAHSGSNTVVASYPSWVGTDFSAWSGKPTYNLQAQRWNTFIRWDFPPDQPLTPAQLAQRIRYAPPGPMVFLWEPFLEMNLSPSRLAAQGVKLEPAGTFVGSAEAVRVYKVIR